MVKPPAPYSDLFDHIRAAYDAHDGACESLTWFWFGRYGGGPVAVEDIERCEDCAVLFWREGTAWINWERDDEDEVWLCGCCARKRGHTITVTHNGVSVAP